MFITGRVPRGISLLVHAEVAAAIWGKARGGEVAARGGLVGLPAQVIVVPLHEPHASPHHTPPFKSFFRSKADIEKPSPVS